MGVLGKYNAVTSNVGSIRFILLLIVELIGLLLFTVIWQLLLTKFDLSFIYLFKGTTVLWGMVFAKIIFNESITACNLLGAIIIVIGIGVSLSE